MFNDSYDVGKVEAQILDLFHEEGGRLTPTEIYEGVGVSQGTGQHPLYHLHAAGWVSRPTRGNYELEYDPRELTHAELAELFADHAREHAEKSHSSAIPPV